MFSHSRQQRNIAKVFLECNSYSEYVVDDIIENRTTRGRIEYKMRWYGYAAADDT